MSRPTMFAIGEVRQLTGWAWRVNQPVTILRPHAAMPGWVWVASTKGGNEFPCALGALHKLEDK